MEHGSAYLVIAGAIKPIDKKTYTNSFFWFSSHKFNKQAISFGKTSETAN
jgi:hypothetical protein